jgi:hypothetical protein
MIRKFKVDFIGTKSLILHSCRTANPMDEYTKKIKAITSKRNKTDDDHINMARLEYIAACYWNENAGFHIPGVNIEACIVTGAKSSKNGKKATLGLRVPEEYVPLNINYNAKTPEELFEKYPETKDVRFVTVNRSKILRCRPRLDRWSLSFNVELDEKEMTIDEFKDALGYAGTRACLGDCRPRYGTFESKVEELG